MVEFPQTAAVRGLFGKALADADGGQPVENAKLAFSQALVDDGPRGPRGKCSGIADAFRGLARADIGRGKDDLGALILRQRREPAARRLGLLEAKVRQGHVDVAHVDVDLMASGLVCRIAGDITLALPVPHKPQTFGPIMTHVAVKARTGGKFSPLGAREIPRQRAG